MRLVKLPTQPIPLPTPLLQGFTRHLSSLRNQSVFTWLPSPIIFLWMIQWVLPSPPHRRQQRWEVQQWSKLPHKMISQPRLKKVRGPLSRREMNGSSAMCVDRLTTGLARALRPPMEMPQQTGAHQTPGPQIPWLKRSLLPNHRTSMQMCMGIVATFAEARIIGNGPALATPPLPRPTFA